MLYLTSIILNYLTECLPTLKSRNDPSSGEVLYCSWTDLNYIEVGEVALIAQKKSDYLYEILTKNENFVNYFYLDIQQHIVVKINPNSREDALLKASSTVWNTYYKSYTCSTCMRSNTQVQYLNYILTLYLIMSNLLIIKNPICL